MGVVHKLKEQVVEYIIIQKQSNPSLGVRQLASLAGSQFQVQISKSSVNNVLKNAALSSSVGRRAGASIKPAKADKFSIPSAKKEEISKGMQQAGIVKADESQRQVLSAPLSLARKKNDETENTERVVRAAQRQDGPELMEAVASDAQGTGTTEVAKGAGETVSPENTLGDYIERARDLKKTKGARFKGAGCVFLKAAQWEISGEHFLERLMKKCLKKPLAGYFPSASDIFTFAQFLGIGDFEKLSAYHDHALWVLNEETQGRDHDRHNTLLELKQLFLGDSGFQGAALRKLIVEYGLERDNAFMDIKGYKLSLEDGSELFVDARMSSFSGSPAAIPEEASGIPVNKALTLLSNCLISNVQDCVFQRIPGENQFGRPVYDMMGAFANLPRCRIRKAALISEKGLEFAEFSVIPAQKRFFIAGVNPSQSGFKELIKAVKWAPKRPYYHELLDKIFYYTDTKSEMHQGEPTDHKNTIRVVTLWEEKDKDPIGAIVTNREKEPGEAIVERYVSSWPYFGADRARISEWVDVPQRSHEKIDNFSGIFKDFAACLDQYVRSHFLPSNHYSIGTSSLMTDIYGIPGQIFKADEYILVTLEVTSAYPYFSDIEFAAKMVNENRIYDSLGRRLWLAVSPS